MSSIATCTRSVFRKALLVMCFFALYTVPAMAQTIPCPPNIDFETGTLANWEFYTGSCCPINTPTLSGPVNNRHTLTSGTGTDAYGGFPVVAPGGGNYSFKLGNNGTGAQAERARYYIHVPVGANNYSFQYAYAVVFEDPSHPVAQQPRFEITVRDSATGVEDDCAEQFFVAGGVLPGFSLSTVGNNVWYKPWSNGTIDLSAFAGKTVIVDFATGDCAASGHFGYGYFDLISCGAYEAPVSSCDLEGTGGITFTAPPGFQSYDWFDPTWTQVATGQIVTIPAPAVPTYYNLVMTPFVGVGCPDTIQTGLVADITVNATPDTLCNTVGVPIQLNAGATGGVGTLEYEWTPGNSLSCDDCPTPVATPSGSVNYIVKVTDSNGCFRRDTLDMLESLYIVDAGPDRVTCIGTPITINASVTPMSSFYVYNWDNPNGLSSQSALQPTFTPTTPGTEMYILKVDSSYCSKVDTMYIRTLPNDFVIHDTVICEGGVVQVYAVGDTAFTYRWSPAIGVSDTTIINPIIVTDTTRTYTVTASYPTCPNIVKTMEVEVQPVPIVRLGRDTSKCQWDDLFIFADVEPRWYNQYTYTWEPNSGLSSHSVPNVIFRGQEDTLLILSVNTPKGCVGKDTVNITVRQGDFASVLPVDTAICPNNTVQFIANGGVAYNWTPATFLDDATSSTPVADPITGMDYTVYVTDQYGCFDTIYASLEVHPEAVLELGDSIVLFPGESHRMNPHSNGLYFTWFPPLGLSSTTVSNPLASPVVNTRYFVTTTTEAGCVASDSIDILVREETVMDLPNAFTPGSAPNDIFKLNKRGIATLKAFKIYNRWGNLVFETTNVEEGWDGTYKGTPQPMGVYVYQIDAVTNSGKRFTKQGNVTLIR